MIRVTGDRVLVALPPKEHVQDEATRYTYQAGHTTGSGIVLAKPADVFNLELATRGIVVALGEKRGQVDLDDVREALRDLVMLSTDEVIDCVWADVESKLSALRPAPFDVQPGDCVLFPPSAGDQIDYDGQSYVILHESELIGVVDPSEE